MMSPSSSSSDSQATPNGQRRQQQQQQQNQQGWQAGRYAGPKPPPPLRPDADVNGRQVEFAPIETGAATRHRRLQDRSNLRAAAITRPVSAIPILVPHPPPAMAMQPPPGHPGLAGVRDYAAAAIAAARQNQRHYQHDAASAAAAAYQPRDAQQKQHHPLLVYSAHDGSHQSIVLPVAAAPPPPQQQQQQQQLAVTTTPGWKPPSPLGGEPATAAISGSSSPQQRPTAATDQRLPTRSALLQFLSTPGARTILAQAAAAAAAQLSKTPTASAAAAAYANITANLKSQHHHHDHTKPNVSTTTTTTTVISKQHHQDQQQQQVQEEEEKQQQHIVPSTKVDTAANNATVPSHSIPPPPQEPTLCNQPEASISIEEKINRQQLQQAYGKENPHIYDRLVRMLGKEEADRMVKEAVDETLFDEEKNTSSSIRKSGFASTSVAHDKGLGAKEGNNAIGTVSIGEMTTTASSSESGGGIMRIAHRHSGSEDADDAAAASTAVNASPSSHCTPQYSSHRHIENVSIDDSAISGGNENDRGRSSSSCSSSSCSTNTNSHKHPSWEEKNEKKSHAQNLLQPRQHKPSCNDDASLINASSVEGGGLGMKRKFDNINRGGSGIHPHETLSPTTNSTFYQTSSTVNNSVAATASVAAPTTLTSVVNTIPSRPRKIFFLDRDGKISCAMVDESNLLRALENSGGLDMMTMTQGGSTAPFVNTITAVDAAVAGHSPLLSAANSSTSASFHTPQVLPTPGLAYPLQRSIDPASATTTTPVILSDSLVQPPPQQPQQQQEDPPGFDQFRSDPVLCSMILRSVHQLRYGSNLSFDGTNGSISSGNDLKGGMFVHGLLNIADDKLIAPPGGKPDLSVRRFAQNVLCPYFHIPPNLAASERHWDAYAHITSDMLYKIASDVVYERRKSMKSAVQLANYELENAHGQNLEESAAKDHRIQELEQELANIKEHHAQIMSEKAYQHFNQIRECEEGYAKFVQSHRKEMRELKKEMDTMRKVHTTFLESYAEASLDALRQAKGGHPSPSSEQS